MSLKLIILLSLLISSVCFAEQRLPVEEGGRVTASVSGVGLNRIAVENDRILSVKGIAGQFQMDKDTKLGQIFLQPTLHDKGEPIHLFITTEKGATYGLSLLVNDLVPESIVLTPEVPANNLEQEIERMRQAINSWHPGPDAFDFPSETLHKRFAAMKANIKFLERNHG